MLTVAGVLVAVGAVVVWQSSGPDEPPLTRADVDKAVQQGIQRAQASERNAPPAAAAAYRAIAPSLVMISIGSAAAPSSTATPGADAGGTPSASTAAPSTPAPGTTAPSSPGASGGGSPTPTVVPVPIGVDTGIGAGVVINAAGAVLTALHVVEPGGKPAAGPIQVRFSDGTAAIGTVTTRQPEGDIAVLSVDKLPQVVVPAVMGGGAQVGDEVFPVGNPMTLEGTLTSGVVSGVNRAVRTASGATLSGLIQFDAPVNPGSSGGPLLNRSGQVIGIVTDLANPSGQKYSVGIGFAVPIDTAGGAAGMPQK